METKSNKQINQKILSIKDRKSRAFLLAEKLLILEQEDLREYLENLVIQIFINDRVALEVIFSLVDVLENIYEFEIMENLYNRIKFLKTENKILNLLIDPPLPHKFLKRGEVHITDIMMDYIPLGVKRSFAKKMDRMLIRRMLQEKDPYVVKNLLSNPLITEKDVLKIASMRPTNQSVIKVIYAFDKWINLYSVKEAIIKNPYSPFRLSLLLLFYMQKKELKDIHSDNTLHPVIREISMEILKIRDSFTQIE